MSSPGLTVELRTLSSAGAKLVLAAAEAAALAKGVAVSIAVVDVAGHLVAFLRTQGACVTSIEAAIRKARTAASLGAPTKLFEDLVDGGMTSLLTFEFISPSQGGVPLRASDVTLGGIGCSGSSGAEDEAIASEGATVLEAALAAGR